MPGHFFGKSRGCFPPELSQRQSGGIHGIAGVCGFLAQALQFIAAPFYPAETRRSLIAVVEHALHAATIFPLQIFQ